MELKKKLRPRIKARLRKMGLQTKLKPRIQEQIREKKQFINKNLDNFFDWIKGAELVELKECITTEDPVRPELDNVLEEVMEEKFMVLSIWVKYMLLCVLLIQMKFQKIFKN